MALTFDEVDDYISIPDHAALTFADADWCVGVWIRVADNSGSLWQYFVSNAGLDTPSFNLYMREDGLSSPGRVQFRITDDAGLTVLDGGVSVPVTTNAFDDGDWHLIIAQRSGDDFEIWSCGVGGTSVLETSNTAASFTTINSANALNLGRRQDGNVDRYYGGDLAEFFKISTSLTSNEITALGNGALIYRLKPANLDLYLPLWSIGWDGNPQELSGNKHIASVISATTITSHPPVTLFNPFHTVMESIEAVGISVTDTISLSPTVSAIQSAPLISVADTIRLSSLPGLSVFGSSEYTISVLDSFAISDDEVVRIVLSANLIQVLDTIKLGGDTLSAGAENYISVTDQISLVDDVGVNTDLTSYPAMEHLFLPLTKQRAL